MIEKLDNADEDIAYQIFTVFQNAYKVEAGLIGAQFFPPLSRSADDIENAKSDFYCIRENLSIVAIIEITTEEKFIDIHSLTVEPSCFGQGLASQLIRHVLKMKGRSKVIVETAEANMPAINLYQKHGFSEFRKWTTTHGIPKVAMSVEITL